MLLAPLPSSGNSSVRCIIQALADNAGPDILPAAMPTPIPPRHIRVAPQYAVYILEKESLTVLYSSTKSLLLQGENETILFQYFNRPHTPWIDEKELLTMPLELQLLAARLLKANVLVYLEINEENPDAFVQRSI